MALARRINFPSSFCRICTISSNIRNFCSPSSAFCSGFLEFSVACDDTLQRKIVQDMQVRADFVNETEEKSLMGEIELRFKRSRYQYDHWDNAIQGYRETEKPIWNDINTPVLSRLKELAFKRDSSIMQHVHILDLADNGHIKPHLDSIKFCGDTISGISLLSASVMRLVHVDRPELFVNCLLPRRSLYIMRDFARYEFNHEILDNSVSVFCGRKVQKSRRVSVICRSQPITTA